MGWDYCAKPLEQGVRMQSLYAAWEVIKKDPSGFPKRAGGGHPKGVLPAAERASAIFPKLLRHDEKILPLPLPPSNGGGMTHLPRRH